MSGTREPGPPGALSVSTSGGTNDFGSSVVIVPTPSSNPESANKAYVDAQVSTAGATNAIYGELYRYDVTNEYILNPTGQWFIVDSWVIGDNSGLTVTTSNMTMAADGEYGLFGSLSAQSAANNKIVEFAYFHDEAVITNSVIERKFGTGGDIGAIPLSGIHAFVIGEKASLRMRAMNATATITMRFGNWQAERIVSSSGGTNWAQYAAASDVDFGGYDLIGAGSVSSGNYISTGQYYQASLPVITYSGTNIVWDCDDGNSQMVVITNNCQLDNPSNLQPSTYVIQFVMDGTGGYAVSYDSWFKWSAGTAPTHTTNASAEDVVTFLYRDTNVLHSMWKPNFQ